MESETIRLDRFLDKLKSIDVSGIVIVDGDQCSGVLSCLDWIYSGIDVQPDYHIFVITGYGAKIDKIMRSYQIITHIEAQNNYRDAADFVICSMLGQAYAYSRMTGVEYYYVLVSNDHFIFGAYDEFNNIGQAIDYIDPKSNRLDLFMLTITEPEHLSWRGLAMRRLLDMTAYKNIDVSFNIDLIFGELEIKYPIYSRHVMAELERQNRGIIIDVTNDDKNDESKLYKYMKSREIFDLVRNHLDEKGFIWMCQLGNLYPLNDEDRKLFGVKNWSQLLRHNPFILNYIGARIDLYGGAFRIAKNDNGGSNMCDIEYLKTRWQNGWAGTSKQFCDKYEIYENDFVSWIRGKRQSNWAGVYAIKKWILDVLDE